GPAGAAAALTLLRYTPLRVAVVEGSGYEAARVGETVPPGMLPLLAYLGVDAAFLADGHLPAYESRAAWGTPHAVTRDFLFTGRGDGWHLDRARFDRTLTERVVEAGGTVLSPARVTGCEGAPGAWRVAVSERGGPASHLFARYVVDATGKRASLARRLGARRRVHDRLVGVTTYWLGEGGDRSRATLVESVRDGWWYSAALPDGRLVAALMTDVEVVRSRGLHRTDALAEMLADAPLSRARLEGTQPTGSPVVRPAHSQILRPAIGDGWIAAGDAAASFDPLSSMGIGHALSSGIQAARVAHDALEHGGRLGAGYDAAVERHFGEFLALRRAHYSAERRWPDSPFWTLRRRPSAAAASNEGV
ncbi:MAG: tryptophan 7-halogenase, partial [Longimicrobiaceae bacterium]